MAPQRGLPTRGGRLAWSSGPGGNPQKLPAPLRRGRGLTNSRGSQRAVPWGSGQALASCSALCPWHSSTRPRAGVFIFQRRVLTNWLEVARRYTACYRRSSNRSWPLEPHRGRPGSGGGASALSRCGNGTRHWPEDWAGAARSGFRLLGDHMRCPLLLQPLWPWPRHSPSATTLPLGDKPAGALPVLFEFTLVFGVDSRFVTN